MEAGIRREDRFELIEGEGFTILMPGADEQAAMGVAERLRRALAHMTLPQSGMHNHFTASFGVAAGRSGDCGETLVARARAALEAAQKAGSDHVVAASEIEEIKFLPAPHSSSAAA
jgi:diguanylate cyclase (GGDEF)-like protein